MIWFALVPGSLIALAYACILCGKAADTLDNTTDEHADHGFIGGTDFFHNGERTSRD
jgi:hypothetical protein